MKKGGFDTEGFMDPFEMAKRMDYIDRHMPPKEAVNFLRWSMRDASRSKEEWSNPDTYGCDRFFLLDFVSPQMEYDFDLVARDFLNEEYENLKKYCSQMYVNDNPRYCSPEESIRYKVLNLMYNAAKVGNEFAVDMFKLLFKLYYKSEYKQLKRFSIMA